MTIHGQAETLSALRLYHFERIVLFCSTQPRIIREKSLRICKLLCI